jgi:hypothetical protein
MINGSLQDFIYRLLFFNEVINVPYSLRASHSSHIT